uniref:Uncharacterized protein n=1 Tax=Steinernema glaseri TaxID=37863 RepID=A0A1I7XWS1_9BILA
MAISVPVQAKAPKNFGGRTDFRSPTGRRTSTTREGHSGGQQQHSYCHIVRRSRRARPTRTTDRPNEKEEALMARSAIATVSLENNAAAAEV